MTIPTFAVFLLVRLYDAIHIESHTLHFPSFTFARHREFLQIKAKQRDPRLYYYWYKMSGFINATFKASFCYTAMLIFNKKKYKDSNANLN